MNEISSVEEILISKVSLEKHFRKKTNKLGWDYTDVLYSFLGVYTIGLNVFNEQDFECKGIIIRPKPRENKRKQAYNYEFILANYNKLNKDLNELEEMKEFIKVYQTIGNVIPIWPGGNVHRGQYQCYDIPDIYFNDEIIKKYSKNFFDTFVKDNNFLDDIMNGPYSQKKVGDFLVFKESGYKKFLTHIVKIIKKRNQLVEKYLEK